MINALGIELYPADDHCVQGCVDCPRAHKVPQIERKTAYYSERTMTMLNKLRTCGVITSVQFASIADRMPNQKVIAFPDVLSARSFVFGIGQLPTFGGSAEIEKFADRVFENATLCLANQPKDRAMDVSFSIVPRMNDSLLLKDVEAVREFFARTLKRVAGDEFPFKIANLIFGLSANDVDSKSLKDSIANFSRVQQTQAELRQMIMDLTSEGGPCLEVNVESSAQDFEVAVRQDVASVLRMDYGRVSLAQRMIEENQGKNRKKRLSLEGRELDIALFDDYAWLYHSKDVVADKSLLIPYAEFEPILDRCAKDRRLSLQNELNKWINRKRQLEII